MNQAPALPAPPRRFDPFSRLFKAQRYAMCDTLMQCSSLDARSPADVHYVLGQVRDMLRYGDTVTRAVRLHVVARVGFHARCSAERIALRCEERIVAIAWLHDACKAVCVLEGAPRAEALAALQQELGAFVARALDGMAWIAQEANRVLWTALPDDALESLEEALLAAPEPGELRYSMQWMIPAIDPLERVQLFAILRRQAGAAQAAAILAMSRDLLPRGAYEMLVAEVG